jgi:hypothetical protein
MEKEGRRRERTVAVRRKGRDGRAEGSGEGRGSDGSSERADDGRHIDGGVNG